MSEPGGANTASLVLGIVGTVFGLFGALMALINFAMSTRAVIKVRITDYGDSKSISLVNYTSTPAKIKSLRFTHHDNNQKNVVGLIQNYFVARGLLGMNLNSNFAWDDYNKFQEQEEIIMGKDEQKLLVKLTRTVLLNRGMTPEVAQTFLDAFAQVRRELRYEVKYTNLVPFGVWRFCEHGDLNYEGL